MSTQSSTLKKDFSVTVWLVGAALLVCIQAFCGQGFASDLGLTEADCRCCHGTSLADRHHLLVNTGGLECMACHEMVFNGTTSQFEPELIRDCLQCHTGSLADRHHVLVSDNGFDCFSCHAMVFDTATQTYAPDFNVRCQDNQPPPAVPSGSVHGAVTGQNGVPLAWVRVASRDGSYATLTTSAGAFELAGMVPGDYVLDVSLDGFTTATRAVTVASDQGTLADFSLAPIVAPGMVTGVVRDFQMASVEGARIFSATGEYSTLSRADGTFILVDLVAGSYHLTAEKTGFSADSRVVTLEAGQTLGVDFVLADLLVEVCDDGLDNDGDGLTDCVDPACAQAAICQAIAVEVCGDGLDNDGNGLTDCGDAVCAATVACSPPVAENCSDGFDNDGDGHIDCADRACATTSDCLPPPVEICDDGLDNDANGRIDCEDIKCAGYSDCLPPVAGEFCGNGLDDNADGLVDCADPQCRKDPLCTGEICGNGQDDNSDGAVDCADMLCANDPLCLADRGNEVCTNLLDDDGNGLTDCEDSICADTPMCRPPVVEFCDNGRDDDMDGLIDCADPECSSYLFCNGSSRVELCDNGLDDDADGKIDCKDKDCKKDPLCPKPGNAWGRTKEKAGL